MHFNKARQELELAKNIDEVKDIRDKAEALRTYIKQAGYSLDMQNQCAEIKIRAERKAGEMLAEQVKPGNPQFLHDERIVKLKDLGIAEIQSHRWQKIASIPVDKFEEHISEITESKEELTSSELLNYAKQLQREESVKEIKEKGELKISLPPEITLLEGDYFEKIKEIDDKSIDLLVTDPPYQVMNDYEWDRKDPEFNDRWLKEVRPKLKDEHIGFIFYDQMKACEFSASLKKYFKVKNILSWIHRNMSMGRVVKDNFISTVDIIFYFGTKNLNFSPDWTEERFNSFEYAVPQSNFKEGKFHPTQKPLDLFKRLIRVGSREGELVADVFAGSGTAALACRDLNRSCILIEKETEYINIIKGRL